MKQTTIVLGVAGILILAAVGFLITRFHGHTQAEDTLVRDPDAVLIQDQVPGDETVVNYAKLSKPGYVVAYSAPTGSDEKEVLGTSDLLPAGEHRNVRIRHHHHTSTTSGSTVTVAVVADDGDGSFVPERDTEVLVPDTGENAEAAVSDDAEPDAPISDEVLIELLDDAGYNTAVDASEDASVDASSNEAPAEPTEEATPATGEEPAEAIEEV